MPSIMGTVVTEVTVEAMVEVIMEVEMEAAMEAATEEEEATSEKRYVGSEYVSGRELRGRDLNPPESMLRRKHCAGDISNLASDTKDSCLQEIMATYPSGSLDHRPCYIWDIGLDS